MTPVMMTVIIIVIVQLPFPSLCLLRRLNSYSIGLYYVAPQIMVTTCYTLPCIALLVLLLFYSVVFVG